jgi:hypothetical protein
MSRKDRVHGTADPHERRRSDRPYIHGVFLAVTFIAVVGAIGAAMTLGSASGVTIVLIVIAIGAILAIPVMGMLDRRR